MTWHPAERGRWPSSRRRRATAGHAGAHGADVVAMTQSLRAAGRAMREASDDPEPASARR